MKKSVNPRICVLAVGTKGAAFLEDLGAFGYIRRVVTYTPRGTQEPDVESFRELALRFGADFYVAEHPDRVLLEDFDCIFTVGWQRLLRHEGLPLIVLHDSLLPRYRGFAPTVSALICGDSRIGVTALLPTTEADAGPILAQSSAEVTHPLRIADAFDLLRDCYREVALDVLSKLGEGPLVGVEQNHAAATAGIWRDAEDLFLNWNEDAERLQRVIYALSFPYPGARTTVEGRVVIVRDAIPVPDVEFAIRQPGKVWHLNPGGPVIVCGSGLLQLTDVVEEDGTSASFRRLRVRFGTTCSCSSP
jgi:methionyl-tRNA formyltransferase